MWTLNAECKDIGTTNTWVPAIDTNCGSTQKPNGTTAKCCCASDVTGCCEKKASNNNITTDNLIGEECKKITYASTTFYQDQKAVANKCTPKQEVDSSCNWKIYYASNSPTAQASGGCNSDEARSDDSKCTGPKETVIVPAFNWCCCGRRADATPSEPPKFIMPELQISIPGLKLTPSSSINYIDNQDGSYQVEIPWLSEYLLSIYNYGLAIAGILAAIILMAGGALWLISGGQAAKITQAKELITGSIVGLAILMSAYLILFQINPDLTKLNPVKIGTIASKQLEVISGNSYTAYTGQVVIPPFSAEMKKAMKSVGQKNGVDPCIFIAIVSKESNGIVNAIGHDENACCPTCCNVLSRVQYLNTLNLGCVNGGGCSHANKDQFPKLDWRYSHGIGLGQVTIFPGDSCMNGEPSKQIGAKCYSIKDLLTLDGALDATAKLWTSYSCERGHYKDGDFECFSRYAGTGAHAVATAQMKAAVYQKCKQTGFDNITSAQ